MIISSYIHEQLADAHRRDLVEAAEHAQVAAKARQGRHQYSARHLFRLALRWPGPHRAALEPKRCASSLTTSR